MLSYHSLTNYLLYINRYLTYTLFTSSCIVLSIFTGDNIKDIMKRLDQGHLHPLQEHPETNKSRPGIEPGPPAPRRRAL
jgi:hypothetical protein